VRIHFVLPQAAPAYGMEKAAFVLMQALAETGCVVSSCTLSGPPAPALTGSAALEVPPGRLRLPRAVPALRRHLMALPADTHIVASGLWAALPVGCALIGTGREYVAWEHSVLPARLTADRRVAGLFRASGRRPVRPRAVVAVSAGVRRTVLSARAGAVVETIPNIVATPAHLPPPRPRPRPDQRTTLVTTGALRPLKNNSAALRALRLLPDSYELKLAGDGPLADDLRAEVRHLGLTERVQFLGRISDVERLLESADVLVHPSLVETFGLSLFEGANAGVPVVAFAVEAIDEIVPRYVPGVLARERTPEALADAILELGGGITPEDATAAWQRRLADLSPEAVAVRWRQVLASTRDRHLVAVS
jgi:glycosyltransferase involved in cell wall biosynthesis